MREIYILVYHHMLPWGVYSLIMSTLQFYIFLFQHFKELLPVTHSPCCFQYNLFTIQICWLLLQYFPTGYFMWHLIGLNK